MILVQWDVGARREECKAQITSFPGARFRKFATEAEARAFVSQAQQADVQKDFGSAGPSGASCFAAPKTYDQECQGVSSLAHSIVKQGNTGSSFYAVGRGKQTGVFRTWRECQAQVTGFNGAKFKKFSTEAEAWAFVNEAQQTVLQNVKEEKAGKFFYAVRRGRQTGVFSTWLECKAQVQGLVTARYKKFATEAEARDFIDETRPVTLQNDAGGASTHCVEKADISYRRKRRKGTGAGGDQQTPNKRRRFVLTSTENDPGDMLHVYTDGACTANGRKAAKAGIGVYWGPNHPMNVSERIPGRQTNNRAEIQAAVRAMQQAKTIGARNLTIYTDSRFMIDSVTSWLPGWVQRNWVLASGGPVKNKEDFQDLLKAAEGLSVKWVHVRGHRGVKGNEEADRLATGALRLPLRP